LHYCTGKQNYLLSNILRFALNKLKSAFERIFNVMHLPNFNHEYNDLLALMYLLEPDLFNNINFVSSGVSCTEQVNYTLSRQLILLHNCNNWYTISTGKIVSCKINFIIFSEIVLLNKFKYPERNIGLYDQMWISVIAFENIVIFFPLE
jgi:hypothetical protein